MFYVSSLRMPKAMKSTTTILPSLFLLVVLLTVITHYYSVLSSFLPSSLNFFLQSDGKCDIFSGEWVRDEEAPYYTNATCPTIHDHQNCMKYGRPDSDFMKWRWRPNRCELPLFNSTQFLELMRGKSMAFVGDSVGRNHMQSLACLLSRVDYPIEVRSTPDQKYQQFQSPKYNFTIGLFWSPFLVKSKEADPHGDPFIGVYNLYLDQFDDWMFEIDKYDYLIISAGPWFFRPTIFYEDGRVVGCNQCNINYVKDLTGYYSYRKAFHTALRWVAGLESFKGITFLRTYSPAHFENGTWNKGGNCVRTRPFRSGETRVGNFERQMNNIQVEELKMAQREANKRGVKFRLLDVTKAMSMRPDGHPSHYGHWPDGITYNDCVHWCLPGPIEAWNDLLFHMLKEEISKELMMGSNRGARVS